MKLIKIITLVLLGTLYITSCASTKKVDGMKLSQDEVDKFSIKGDTIYYNFEQVGIVQNIEWEYLPGDKDMRMEISINQTNPYDNDITRKIIKYVHTRYPNAKIEVNFDE